MLSDDRSLAEYVETGDTVVVIRGEQTDHNNNNTYNLVKGVFYLLNIVKCVIFV